MGGVAAVLTCSNMIKHINRNVFACLKWRFAIFSRWDTCFVVKVLIDVSFLRSTFLVNGVAFCDTLRTLLWFLVACRVFRTLMLLGLCVVAVGVIAA